jgi:MFS family permease
MSAHQEVAGSYRRLLRVPVLRGLAAADFCARLPQGMVTVTLLLVAATHASMTTAGLVVTGYTLGQAVTGPLRGRLADRCGLAAVCAACGGVYALALLCLLAGSLAGGPVWLLVATAAVAGLTVPPLSPGMRSLWSAHAPGPLRQAAFALDAAVFDLAYIAGPVVASSLATDISPAAAVGVLVALTCAATVIIGTRIAGTRIAGTRAVPGTARASGAPRGAGRRSSTDRQSGERPPARRSVRGPLNSAALRRLLVTGALVNVALSGTEVALTGYVRQHHALWASGPLLAELSVGSIAGSLLLGARASAARDTGPASAGEAADAGEAATAGEKRGSEQDTAGARRLPRLLACYALGLTALTAAALHAPLIAVAAPLAGLCLGPSLATLFGLTSNAVPGGGGTEAQAWLNSAMNGGAAAGAALAGATAGRPVLALASMAVAAAAAAGTAALAGLGRASRRTGQARAGPWFRAAG